MLPQWREMIKARAELLSISLSRIRQALQEAFS